MAVVPEQSVLDLVVAYKHLSEEEQARFWALMDKQRAEFMFSSKSRRELMARAAAGPSVPHEVAERMKQVRPPVSFQGDIRESAKALLASAKAAEYKHGIKFLEEKKVMFATHSYKKPKHTGRAKKKKRELIVSPTTRTLHTTGKQKAEITYELSELKSMTIKKGHVVLKFADMKPTFAFKNGAIKNQFCLLVRSLIHGQPTTISQAPENLNIFVTTWNVGNAPPTNQPLGDWIPTNKYDLYVVGAQECKYHARDHYQSCEDDWFSTLNAHLGEDYVFVKKASLWQIRLGVWIKRGNRHLQCHGDAFTIMCENLSVIGNKGGVAIAFNYYETSFCFVNSHLAAHQAMIKERNDDVKKIIDSIRIGTKEDLTTAFDYVFWCGDLNYRIEGIKDGVQKGIAENKLDDLYTSFDQLAQEMRKNNVFYGFKEGYVTFNPTYKFDPGKPHTEYSDDRNRIPSWCDRILYTSTEGYQVTQHSYNACYTITSSDHVPVFSHFSLPGMYRFLDLMLILQVHLPFFSWNHAKHGHIVIHDIYGRGLNVGDTSGYSDPFLKFRGAFLKSHKKTKVQKATLNPNWDNEIITLDPVVGDLNFIKKQVLHIDVWDWDKAQFNDLLGRARVSLTLLSDKTQEVKATVMKQGRPGGFIYFKMLFITDD